MSWDDDELLRVASELQGFLPVKADDTSQLPPIVLSYAARDYGRVPNGMLIVATADTQWVFALGIKFPTGGTLVRKTSGQEQPV